MSAFQVSPAHLSVIVNAWIGARGRVRWNFRGRQLDSGNADDWQVALDHLATVNADSYPGEPAAPVAGKVRGFAAPLSPVATIKALECFEYQASEHEGWATSGLPEMLRELTGYLHGMLPGYAEADWSIV